MSLPAAPAAAGANAPAACALCGNGEPAPFYPAVDIVQCPACGLVYYARTVDTEPLYGEGYFKGDEYFDYNADKAALQRNFRRYRDRLEKHSRGGRLLELGCAYGFFLEVAGERWKAEGMDLSAAAVDGARARGLAARRGDFLDLPDEPGAFDVVCLWDTLEHLSRPVETIKKAARWLKPGGVLALTTGDIGSVMARLRGARWRLIHPPTHLFYFSQDTLFRAFTDAGLEPVEASHVGYSRGYSAMLYQVFAQGKKTAWVHKALTLGGRVDFPVYLNLYDILFVAARRPG